MQFIVLFNPVGNFSYEIKGSIYKLLSLQNRQKSQFKKIDYFFPLLWYWFESFASLDMSSSLIN